MISAVVSLLHLISALPSALSNHASYSLAQKCAPKIDPSAKASHPDAFHRENLTRRNFYTQHAFAQRNLYTQKLLHRDREVLFTEGFCTETFTQSKLLHTETFTHRNFLHRETFTQRSLCTAKFLHRNFYTENPLTQRNLCTHKLFHRDCKTFTRRQRHLYSQKAFTQSKLLHTANFYREKLLHREAFTRSKLLHTANFYTEKLLHSKLSHKEHTENFYTKKLLYRETLTQISHTASLYTAFTQRKPHTENLLHRKTFTQRSFYTQKLLHTEAFTHRSLHTQKLLQRETLTQRNFYTEKP